MARKKRLNVNFLVALVTITAVVLVGAAVAGWWYKDSPGRAISRAQEAEEQGDWRKAAEQWAKAARASNDPQYQLKAIDAAMKATSEPDGLDLIRKIQLNYTGLLASDPTMMQALRGQMRLWAGERSFAGPRATLPTREVRRLAGEILKQEPSDTEARTLRALATINLAQFTGEAIDPADVEQAELDLRAVSEVDPGDGLAVWSLVQRMLMKAEQLRVAGSHDEALEHWAQTVSLVDEVSQEHGELSEKPTLLEARLHWHLGQSYSFAARHKPLLEASKLAAGGMRAQEIEALNLATEAGAAEATRKWHQHVAVARSALSDERDVLQEDYREIRTAYADSLMSQDRTQEGEAELRAIWEARPWDVMAGRALGSLYQQQGRVEEAVAVVRQMRKSEELVLPVLEGHAGVNARTNRLIVKPFMVEVLFMRHDMVQDNQERKQLLTDAKAIQEEFETLRKSIGFPATSDSIRMLAQIQMAEGDLGSSVQTLTEALRFTASAQSAVDRRERLKVLAMLVDANRRLGQLGAQQRYLEEMVQLAPGAERFQRELAQIYLSRGDRQKARAIIDRLLRQTPDDPALQQLLLQAAGPEEQEITYAQLPEQTPQQQQAKLAAAVRLGKPDETVRLANAVRDGLPPAEQRTPEQQRQHDALTMTIAQQLGLMGQKQQAIALVEPLAEKNLTAKALLAQLEGGTEALLDTLPAGASKLMLEAQLAEMRGDQETALAKLEAAARVEPANTTAANRLFGAYLARQRIEDAQRLADQLRAQNADEMQGGSYGVRLALARGDDDEALRAATTLARDYPQFAEALALHGEALRQSGRAGEAVDSYRRSLEIAPNSPSALTGILAALEAANRYQEARPYIDAALRLQPNNTFFRNADRAFQIRFGDPAQVIAARRIAVQDNPESADAYLDLGQTLILAADAAERMADEIKARERLTEAAGVLSEALLKFPDDMRLLQGLVEAAGRSGPEAIAAAEPAMQASVAGPQAPLGSNPQAVALAADFYAQKPDLIKAESIARAALGEQALSREGRASLLMTLSALLVRQDRNEDALAVLSGYEDVPGVLQRKIELLATRVGAAPQDEELYRAMRQASDPGVTERTLPIGGLVAVAYAEVQRGDVNRAVTLLDQALSRQASHPRALLLRGAVEARRTGGDMERASQWLEQARRLSPDDPDTYRELSRLQRQRGQQEEAIASMNRLTELEPQNVPVRLELINLLLSLNPPRFTEANRHFRAAERAGVADHPMLLMTRAEMERLRGRVDQGLPFALRAVEQAEQSQSPDTPALLQNYLSLLLEAKKHQDVLDRVESLRTSQPDLPWWAEQAMGDALAGLGRTGEAVVAYRQAVTKAQPLGLDDAVLIDMQRRLGFEAAYELIKQKVEPSDGSSPQPRDLLVGSALLAGAGRVDRAITLLEQARSHEANLNEQQRATLDLQLGTLYLQTSPRRLDEAITRLERALQTHPENVGALNNLAYALTLRSEQHRDSGDTDKAQDDILRAVEIAGQANEFDALMARRLNRDQTPTILDTHGWAIGVQGLLGNSREQQQEAVRLLREARRLAENAGRPQPEIYLHLSRLLTALEEGEQAQESAETGLAALTRVRNSSEPMDPHLDAELSAALELAREMASKAPQTPQGTTGSAR